MDERGQVIPLVAVVILLAGVVCLMTGRLGGAAVARARAVTAADAAALAGASSGEVAARQAAAANGARVLRYERTGGDTRVVVALGSATATARARREGALPVDAGPAPALRAALVRAAELLGEPVPVSTGPTDAVPERAARHAAGLAVHVPASFAPRLSAVASLAGLCRPAPHDHPVHFEVCSFRLR